MFGGVSTLSVAGCITSYMGSVRTIVQPQGAGEAGFTPGERTERRAAPRRSHRARSAGPPPRPVACGRSYAPDLHGSRLTVRGRVVVGVLWAALVAAMAVMIAQPPGPPEPAETATVVVRPGDTLWGLAGEVAPGADRRVTVDQITELNGLRSAAEIAPGDVLVVPAVGPGRADAP